MVDGTALFQQPTTPNQIKSLRKEASQRMARKDVPIIFLEDGADEPPFTDEVLREISDSFTSRTELIQVRSISRNEPRRVFSISEQLAFDLSIALAKTVDLVQYKGHASIFYCPVPGEGSIALRSSYKENAWAKRPKAPRDNRGQIIRD